MKTRFRDSEYEVVFTEHAKLQMGLRGLSESEVLDVLRTGEVKPKSSPGKFWVYRELPGRRDNLISISIVIEKPHLIVITTLVNWRPR